MREAGVLAESKWKRVGFEIGCRVVSPCHFRQQILEQNSGVDASLDSKDVLASQELKCERGSLRDRGDEGRVRVSHRITETEATERVLKLRLSPSMVRHISPHQDLTERPTHAINQGSDGVPASLGGCG